MGLQTFLEIAFLLSVGISFAGTMAEKAIKSYWHAKTDHDREVGR